MKRTLTTLLAGAALCTATSFVMADDVRIIQNGHGQTTMVIPNPEMPTVALFVNGAGIGSQMRSSTASQTTLSFRDNGHGTQLPILR